MDKELVHLGVKVPRWMKDEIDEFVEEESVIRLQPYSRSALVRDAVHDYIQKERKKNGKELASRSN